MLFRGVFRVLAILALSTVATSVWAKPVVHRMKPYDKTINIFTKANLDGQTLKPGHYRLLVIGNEAKLMRNHMLAAEAPCQWKQTSVKADNNALVLSAKNELTEIEFAGKTQVLELH